MRHLTPALAAAALLSHGFVPARAADAPVEYRRSSLIERTPFAKPEKGTGKAVSGGPLELRGFFTTRDEVEVSLTRTDTRESRWVRVGDESSSWVVESADPVAGNAVVRYDGLTLRLALVRPEEPVMQASAGSSEAPADSEKSPENRPRRGGRGAWNNMSPAGREAMRSAMREGFARARSEHPEYFDGTKLSPEQTKAREEYMRDSMNKVRESVAKEHPEDAAMIPDMLSAPPPSPR